MTFKQFLFSFNGRMARLDYFLMQVLLNVLGFVGMAGIENLHQAMPMVMAPLAFVGAIILVWCGIAVGVKRWHDMNKSGWLMLLLLVPLVNVIVLFVLLFAPGTAGANRFGEPQPSFFLRK